MRNVRPVDWAYLVVSFALSLWLIEAQQKDITQADVKIRVYWRIAKICREVRYVVLRLERHALDLCNQELERRN